jgi:hypothetical protein
VSKGPSLLSLNLLIKATSRLADLLSFSRGHVRPILHLALNILTLHPTLHLTLLLAPSVAPRVERELKSANFAHIHKAAPPTLTGPSPDGTPKPDGHSTVDRLQIIEVVSERLKDVGAWDAATMLGEAQDYAATLPGIVSMLYGGEQVDGFVNEFADIAPSFMIYDVGPPHPAAQISIGRSH